MKPTITSPIPELEVSENRSSEGLRDARSSLPGEAKREGKTIVEEEPPKRAPVIDMMEALKRSLQESEAQKRKKPMRRPAAREREGRRRLAS